MKRAVRSATRAGTANARAMKNPNREHWNDQQQALRQALANPLEYQRAIELFLDQHAMLHAADMSGSGLWSFADEAYGGLGEKTMRCVPRGGEHSIAWVIWHITRIEDVTMNLLVTGSPQLFHQGNWKGSLKVSIENTGNAMSTEAVAELSAAVDVQALCSYRAAVGQRTREIVQQIRPEKLRQKVDPSRIQRVRSEGAVVEEANEILDYWSGLTISGLLLMPPTRHNFLHLNEILRIKSKCR